MEISFRISAAIYHLSRTEVLRKLKDIDPEPIRTHAVAVEGQWYPMKQAFEVVTGIDRLDFNTIQARTQFRRLGFSVRRVA